MAVLGTVDCDDTDTRRESSKNEKRRVTFWSWWPGRMEELSASKERFASSFREPSSPDFRVESFESLDKKLVFRVRVVHWESGRVTSVVATFNIDSVYCTTS